MRRTTGLVAVAAMAVVGGLQGASTAGNDLPSSTLSYRSVTVHGADALSFDYAVVGPDIRTFDVRLRGTGLLTTNVQAQFGSDDPVPCVTGLLSVVGGLLSGLKEGTYTCTLLTPEPAARPRALLVAVS